jgi:hypothetical protein
MENYNLAMFTHAMDFFKERVNLKKPGPKIKFYKPPKRLIDRGFCNVWQLVFNKVHKAPKTNVCNSKLASLGAT